MLKLIMFDIDGTLINSACFEDDCFLRAINKVIKRPINSDWSTYQHVSDAGILDEIIDHLGLDAERASIHREVKNHFIDNISQYLDDHPIVATPGAIDFIHLLRARSDIEIAIATGGWRETAQLKLDSAGINYAGLSFASSSDHSHRTAIMKIAQQNCRANEFSSVCYFGDANWDKKSSKQLGYDFIAVGHAVDHPWRVDDFSDAEGVLELLGL